MHGPSPKHNTLYLDHWYRAGLIVDPAGGEVFGDGTLPASFLTSLHISWWPSWPSSTARRRRATLQRAMLVAAARAVAGATDRYTTTHQQQAAL
jgi:hypothetical protein